MASYCAEVESTHEDGAPWTLRDEAGRLWRVAEDAGDGTLAVEAVGETDLAGVVIPIEDYDAYGCGLAHCEGGGAFVIYPARSHGENYTDPSTYEAGDCVYFATRQGWRLRGESA